MVCCPPRTCPILCFVAFHETSPVPFLFLVLVVMCTRPCELPEYQVQISVLVHVSQPRRRGPASVIFIRPYRVLVAPSASTSTRCSVFFRIPIQAQAIVSVSRDGVGPAVTIQITQRQGFAPGTPAGAGTNSPVASCFDVNPFSPCLKYWISYPAYKTAVQAHYHQIVPAVLVHVRKDGLHKCIFDF